MTVVPAHSFGCSDCSCSAGRQRGKYPVLCGTAVAHRALGIAQVTTVAFVRRSVPFQQHLDDTLAAGADLCDSSVADEIVRRAPAAIASLEAMGLKGQVRRTFRSSQIELEARLSRIARHEQIERVQVIYGRFKRNF